MTQPLKYSIRKLVEPSDNRDNDTEPALTEAAVEAMSQGFGKGIGGRTILVTKGISIKALHELSKQG